MTQPYDKKFVVQQYIKSHQYIKSLFLQPVGKPVAFVAEMEQ